MRSVPADEDLPVSAIIESYAKDQVNRGQKVLRFVSNVKIQDLWISEFIPTFEKMMSNGYDPSELTAGPNSWENVICSLENSVISCQQN